MAKWEKANRKMANRGPPTEAKVGPSGTGVVLAVSRRESAREEGVLSVSSSAMWNRVQWQIREMAYFLSTFSFMVIDEQN